MTTDDRQLAVVNVWFEDRGFGFLRLAAKDFEGRITKISDKSVPDIFMHVSETQRAGFDPAEGDIVAFRTATDSRSGKAKATDVKRLGNLWHKPQIMETA